MGGLVVVGAVAGVGVANAAPPVNRTDSQMVSPATAAGGTTYYSDEQVDQVWKAVTDNYPEPLPAGVTFPSKAPAFFHPDTPAPHFFEAGLPDMIAAQYWRCAWLGASAADTRTGASSARQAATVELNKFTSLPSVKTHLDFAAYQSMVSNYSKSSGLNSIDAEIKLQCAGFDIQGGK